MSRPKPTTYWEYIRLDELLALQTGVDGAESRLDNEEVLFITVHQVFELWFKLILKELVAARDLFKSPRVAEQELSGAVGRLRRAATILRVACMHFEVVETLGTREYLAFRGKLGQASGFQSAQMRQIEIVLGLQDEERVPFGSVGTHLDALRDPAGGESPSYRRVAAAMSDRPSLKEALEVWLRRTPIDGSHWDDSDATETLDGFVDRFLAAHRRENEAARARASELAASDADRQRIDALYAGELDQVRGFLRPTEAEGGCDRARVRAAMLFIESYRELPLLAWPREVLAALIELEQAFLVFRQRHARMVERVIGRRAGTGGTAGVDYLDQTALRYRIFRDLWAVRSILLRRDAAPRLRSEEFYAFRES